MKRLIAVGLISVSLVSTARAGTIDCTTSAQTDAALDALRTTFNAGRTVPLSDANYRAYLVTQWLDSLTTQGKAVIDDQLKKAAQAAPDEIKAQVKNLLTCGKVVCP